MFVWRPGVPRPRTSLFLKRCGCLALVPQASEKPFGQDNITGNRAQLDRARPFTVTMSRGIPLCFLGQVFFWEAWGARSKTSRFIKKWCLFGLGTPGLQKTIWPKKHYGIPLEKPIVMVFGPDWTEPGVLLLLCPDLGSRSVCLAKCFFGGPEAKNQSFLEKVWLFGLGTPASENHLAEKHYGIPLAKAHSDGNRAQLDRARPSTVIMSRGIPSCLLGQVLFLEAWGTKDKN